MAPVLAVGRAGYFYPRSPCGERRRSWRKRSNHHKFLSTLSLRRATVAPVLAVGRAGYFYPRSPCGERLHLYASSGVDFAISIHALLAESDVDKRCKLGRHNRFLSTLSLRRATRIDRNIANGQSHFYPRSPCGERLPALHNIFKLLTISIHALLAESDEFRKLLYPGSTNFYPRSPCGERRVHYDNYNLHCVISIHALLAESDGKAL